MSDEVILRDVHFKGWTSYRNYGEAERRFVDVDLGPFKVLAQSDNEAIQTLVKWLKIGMPGVYPSLVSCGLESCAYRLTESADCGRNILVMEVDA